MELTLEELEALEPGSYTPARPPLGQGDRLRHHSRLRSGQRRRPAGGASGRARPHRAVLHTRQAQPLKRLNACATKASMPAASRGGYLAWLMRQMQRQEAEELCSRVENSLRKRFRLKLWCNFTKAIRQYELVKPNDRIAVCMSGGKDSMLMAKLFQELQRYTKFPFSVEYLVMDPGYSPENRRSHRRKMHES